MLSVVLRQTFHKPIFILIKKDKLNNIPFIYLFIFDLFIF